MREQRNAPSRTAVLQTSVGLAACILASSVSAQPSPFATRVMAFVPGPGQFVQNGLFNDPAAALGPPATGGLSAANNNKMVSLGGFGGTITLGFDHAVVNHSATAPQAANPAGVDLIVYGNAFFVAGNATRRFAEAGVIEVSADVNGNGLADDAWFVIRGSHLPGGAGVAVASGLPADALLSVTFDDDVADAMFGPARGAWIPPGRSGAWTVTGFALPSAFNGPIVNNPLGSTATEEGFWGYADCTPGLLLGDFDGDGVIDDATVTAEAFFTRPDDPFAVGVSPGSGGGDAIDISWAVDAATGAAANLQSIDFVRITTAVNFVHPVFGENSTELSGIAEVRIDARGSTTDFNGDGVTDPDDLADFIGGFFSMPVDARTDFNGDGVIDPDDLADFIGAFFS